MMKKFTFLTCLLMCMGLGLFTGSAQAQTFVNFSINQPAAPVSAFMYTNAGLNTTFTDQSTGNITSWMWDFGDGNTSTMQNPSHSYAGGGSQVVCLTVTDNNGCSSTNCDTILLVGVQMPSAFAAVSVQPNPFERETEVSFELPKSGKVSIEVLDMNGKIISSTPATDMAAGAHSFKTGKELPAGMYFVSLTVDGERIVRRIVKQSH